MQIRNYIGPHPNPLPLTREREKKGTAIKFLSIKVMITTFTLIAFRSLCQMAASVADNLMHMGNVSLGVIDPLLT